MDRRTFLLSSAVVPLIPRISWADGWSEYLPCGQLVQFSAYNKWWFGERTKAVKCEMRRRGINYALGCIKDVPDHPLERRLDNLRFHMTTTCYQVDVKDGLASEDDWERYHFKEIAN